MPYLVTYKSPPKTGEIKTEGSSRFEDFSEAKDFVEDLIAKSATNVEVWSLYATPKIVTAIEW
jgi:hypothetical protein